MTQPEKSWLDENGRHISLDGYLDIWQGWNDLLSQIVEETGMTREETVAMIWATNGRGAVEALRDMSKYFRELTESYKDMAEAHRETHAANERLRKLAEKQMEDMDGDAPWKDPG